tara:strand:- start:4293 stop:4643 length:351 start_codon:yes stop_codon:yes gene_type:complete
MKSTEVKDNNELLISSKDNSNTFINIFISTFISVFLAELGDKTQIATLILSAQSGKPLLVFTGAALALICSTLFVVLLGNWLSKNVPQIRIRIISSFIMIFIGLWFGFQAIEAFLS